MYAISQNFRQTEDRTDMRQIARLRVSASSTPRLRMKRSQASPSQKATSAAVSTRLTAASSPGPLPSSQSLLFFNCQSHTDTSLRVTVVDAAQGHTVATLPTKNVFELGFSPLGTYIITWERPTKDENGDAVKNLKVWRTVDDEATR